MSDGGSYWHWSDFEPEPDLTGDGSGDPNKHYLTVWYGKDDNFDEMFLMVHRASDTFPIDGMLANHKRRLAEWLVDHLNETGELPDRLYHNA